MVLILCALILIQKGFYNLFKSFSFHDEYSNMGDAVLNFQCQGRNECICWYSKTDLFFLSQTIELCCTILNISKRLAFRKFSRTGSQTDVTSVGFFWLFIGVFMSLLSVMLLGKAFWHWYKTLRKARQHKSMTIVFSWHAFAPLWWTSGVFYRVLY